MKAAVRISVVEFEVTTTPMIATGTGFTVMLKSDGTVWTWGLGTSGQLGNGTLITSSSPVQVIKGAQNLYGEQIYLEKIKYIACRNKPCISSR